MSKYPTKIDGHTGCEVLTIGGFFQKMADEEGEGRSGGELFTEMMEEIDADMDAEARRIESDKPAALALLKREIAEAIEADPDETDPFGLNFGSEDIVEVLEVKANVGGSFRESSTSMDVRLRLVDDTTRVVRYTSWSFSGSWSEPPDGETNILVVEANGKPVVHTIDKRNPGWPVCEVCQTFGSTHAHGPLHFNDADCLVPLSEDQGKTIERLVPMCWPHKSEWQRTADWLGPVVQLKQEAPPLPYVTRSHAEG